MEKTNSQPHYDGLMSISNGVNQQLLQIKTTVDPELLDKVLETIENQIVKLTQQSPYTLLMMRVVEIGLPLLLSIFSVFFVFRYTLTEKRSHEIKELLRQRNLELLKE
jgi:glycoside/pentoside/hexuronide:cation symporter, GPH family